MKAPLGALLACTLTAPAHAAFAQTAPTQTPEKQPVIQQRGDNYILNFAENQADQLPLIDFVKLAQGITGFNFTYDQGTSNLLQQGKVVMLGGKEFAKTEFYNFFQIQLFINDFVCV